jgi:hypothetical protein
VAGEVGHQQQPRGEEARPVEAASAEVRQRREARGIRFGTGWRREGVELKITLDLRAFFCKTSRQLAAAVGSKSKGVGWRLHSCTARLDWSLLLPPRHECSNQSHPLLNPTPDSPTASPLLARDLRLLGASGSALVFLGAESRVRLWSWDGKET